MNLSFEYLCVRYLCYLETFFGYISLHIYNILQKSFKPIILSAPKETECSRRQHVSRASWPGNVASAKLISNLMYNSNVRVPLVRWELGTYLVEAPVLVLSAAHHFVITLTILCGSPYKLLMWWLGEGAVVSDH